MKRKLDRNMIREKVMLCLTDKEIAAEMKCSYGSIKNIRVKELHIHGYSLKNWRKVYFQKHKGGWINCAWIVLNKHYINLLNLT